MVDEVCKVDTGSDCVTIIELNSGGSGSKPNLSSLAINGWFPSP